MADLIAVQCPRCGKQTVAGHRDCLVCGQTIHPEVDPRACIQFCMEIRGREIFFYRDTGPMRALWLLLIPVIGAPVAYNLREFNFATISFGAWAVAALGVLAVAVISRKVLLATKSTARRKVLLKLDRDGLHFPQFDDVLIPWSAIETTSGSGSPYPKLWLDQPHQIGADISFRVKRDLAIDPTKYSGLNYNPLSRTVTLAKASIDPQFVCQAVEFFGPILTQEK